MKPPQIDPILSAKLTAIPPPIRASQWDTLVRQVIDMPDDGVWLEVRLRPGFSPKAARQHLFKWKHRHTDAFDCDLETHSTTDTIYIRKVLHRPYRRKPGPKPKPNHTIKEEPCKPT